MNLNHRLCSVLHAVCLVPVATLCVMLSLMLCCPARALGYKLLYFGTHSQAIRNSNTMATEADRGDDYMEINDACFDNAVALVHLEDSLILEGGDLEQLSSTVVMTAPDITAKKARKHSNKRRS